MGSIDWEMMKQVDRDKLYNIMVYEISREASITCENAIKIISKIYEEEYDTLYKRLIKLDPNIGGSNENYIVGFIDGNVMRRAKLSREYSIILKKLERTFSRRGMALLNYNETNIVADQIRSKFSVTNENLWENKYVDV